MNVELEPLLAREAYSVLLLLPGCREPRRSVSSLAAELPIPLYIAELHVGLLGRKGLADVRWKSDRRVTPLAARRSRDAENLMFPPGLLDIITSFEPRDLPRRWRG